MSQREFDQLWTFTAEPQFSLCLMGLKLLPLPLALGEITPGLVSKAAPRPSCHLLFHSFLSR